MKISGLLKKYQNQIDMRELQVLIAHIIQKPIEHILAHPDIGLSTQEKRKLAAFARKRKAGYPIAYLTGRKEFFGLDFLVDKNVLIPRPETEMMVEEALSRITHNAQRITVIDVGTGSGCIIVSIVRKLELGIGDQESGIRNLVPLIPSSRFPISPLHSHFFALDISPKALKVARQNAKRHGADKCIKFIQGNLLEPIIQSMAVGIGDSRLRGNDKRGKADFRFPIPDSRFLIIANLPYLTPSQIKNSPSIQREPKSALEAGRDGLKYYRKLFDQIKKLKKANPKLEITILCEIDDTQSDAMQKLIRQKFGNTGYQVRKDLGGYERMAMIDFLPCPWQK